MLSATIIGPGAHGQVINDSLWVAQAAIFTLLCIGGFMKLLMPVQKISERFAWTGQVSEPFLRFIGVVDFAGGVGILLPALTHVLPRLTVFTALGCVVLQILAIGFHARRGEIAETPFNFFLLALSLFVLWGRWHTVSASLL